MLRAEVDLTPGGRPVLRLDVEDTTREGERLLYLSVTARMPGATGNTFMRGVFIGITKEELQLAKRALDMLEVIADADGDML